jgi:hypothetical protein
MCGNNPANTALWAIAKLEITWPFAPTSLSVKLIWLSQKPSINIAGWC